MVKKHNSRLPRLILEYIVLCISAGVCLFFCFFFFYYHVATVLLLFKMHYIQTSTLQSAWNHLDLFVIISECWNYISEIKKKKKEKKKMKRLFEKGPSWVCVCFFFLLLFTFPFISRWAFSFSFLSDYSVGVTTAEFSPLITSTSDLTPQRKTNKQTKCTKKNKYVWGFFCFFVAWGSFLGGAEDERPVHTHYMETEKASTLHTTCRYAHTAVSSRTNWILFCMYI